jgi:hypothetical protein
MRPPLGLDYFHAFEDDLAQISRYIEFHPDNYKTYSLELVRLLLATGSEVDVALKEFCKMIQPSGAPTKNINDHKAVVLGKYKDMHRQSITMPRFDITLTPWKDWPTANPPWWMAYNDVKHNRLLNYRCGNLENSTNAVGALGIIMQYVAGPTALAGCSPVNFRGTLGGLFTGLHLTLRT